MGSIHEFLGTVTVHGADMESVQAWTKVLGTAKKNCI